MPHTVVNTKPDVPKSRSVPPAQQSGFVASERPAAAPDETTGRVVDIKL